MDVAACRQARRHFARSCTGWTQRAPHLAGALGASLAAVLIGRGWLRRAPGGRALLVGAGGAAGLPETFGVTIPEPAAAGPAGSRAGAAAGAASPAQTLSATSAHPL